MEVRFGSLKTVRGFNAIRTHPTKNLSLLCARVERGPSSHGLAVLANRVNNWL